MSFGARVKQRRKELGLTQRELATLVGISRSAVNSWEMGDHVPGGEPAMKLPKALKCSWEFLKSGRDAPATMISEPSPDYFLAARATRIRSVDLVEKSQLGAYLSGAAGVQVGAAGEKAVGIVDAIGAGARTFAFVETGEGMAPRIEPGDTVYIDPDQNQCAPSREVWLFRVGTGYALGVLTETPRGLMLRFDNAAPGWEPIQVAPEDCAGKVVAFVPSWIG